MSLETAGLKSLEPLARIPTLQRLQLFGVLPVGQVAALRKARPDLVIQNE